MSTFFSTEKKYGPNDPKQKAISDALVLHIACDLVPFSTVDSHYFRDLLHKANSQYQVPSRKHLVGKLLREKREEDFNSLKEKVEKVDSVCVTLDLWSSRQMRSYLGITAHFILDWKLGSALLACKRFTGRHTHEMIMQEYEETIHAFGLQDKVSHIITDNASNMISAFALPGLITPPADDTDEDDDLLISDEELLDISALPAEHSPCFAHTLQLVIKDAFKGAAQLNRVLGKTSKIVNHVHKSTVATELLADEPRLQPANATRWNSQMKMIRSVLKTSEEKLNQLDAPTLGAYERNILRDMAEILEPFEEATDYVQKQNSASSGYVLPCIRGLQYHLNEMNSKYNSGFVHTLKQSLDKRMAQYENNRSFRMPACLDARFKLGWTRDTAESSRVQAELTLVARTSSDEPVVDQAVREGPTDAVPRSKLFRFMATAPPTQGTQASACPIAAEVQQYLSEPCIADNADSIQYWQGQMVNLPTLAKLAKRYLSLQASSAPVERIFSIAGKVFRPDRCQMNDENFETIMFIKCNDCSHM